jgi:pimeloyl-ACP methyl ester carboxylesterase
LTPLIQRGAKIYLFAHSQGGLVCRWAIEKAGASNVVMLVMFSAPNEGIPYSAIQIAARQRALASHPETNLDDPALLAMATGIGNHTSTFLSKLNALPATPSTAAYYTIDGDYTFSGGFQTRNPLYFTHLVLVDGPDDGVVYTFSAEGRNIGLSHYCRAYDSQHNLTLNLAHDQLTNIAGNLPIERQTLGTWIRSQTGGIDVTVQ